MRLGILIPLVAVLCGCAAPSRYQWGGYDEMLYQGYKDPSKMETMRVSLEKHIDAIEQSKQKVAPGLYAELGTLYLQKGEATKAVGLYTRERDAWPESRGLMDAMIKNVERRTQASQEAKK